jgi:hypothetical protein
LTILWFFCYGWWSKDFVVVFMRQVLRVLLLLVLTVLVDGALGRKPTVGFKVKNIPPVPSGYAERIIGSNEGRRCCRCIASALCSSSSGYFLFVLNFLIPNFEGVKRGRPKGSVTKKNIMRSKNVPMRVDKSGELANISTQFQSSPYFSKKYFEIAQQVPLWRLWTHIAN